LRFTAGESITDGYGKHQKRIIDLSHAIDQIQGMPKPQLQWIVTANFTADGSVAYLRADQTFSGAVADVFVFDTKEAAEAALQLAAAAEQLVSDPYLTEVAKAPQGGLDVLTTRERIRAHGPTVPYGRTPNPTIPR
jgi:Protein of unknown function (DUF2849)